MGGNLANRTALAMRFTSCVTLVMNSWDQRAGFVRKAWPGAASNQPAEVREEPSAAWPCCDGHFLHCVLLILLPPVFLHFITLTITHHAISPTDHFYNLVNIFCVTSLLLAPFYLHYSAFWASNMPTTFFYTMIHFTCDPWSYFFMYFGHCPESFLNAVTCDIPASLSFDSLLTLR